MFTDSSGLGPKTGPSIFQLGQPTQIIWTTVLLLIRPPDIEMSKSLSFTTVIFLPVSYPIFLHRAAAAHQMYTTGSDMGILDPPSEHSRHPYSDFYRGSQSVILADRSSTTVFFVMKQRIAVKVSYLLQRRWNSVLPEIIWCSFAHPLWWIEFENPPVEKSCLNHQ